MSNSKEFENHGIFHGDFQRTNHHSEGHPGASRTEEGSVLEFVADETGNIFLRPRADDGTNRVFGALKEFAPREPISVGEMKAVVKARAARKVRGKTR